MTQVSGGSYSIYVAYVLLLVVPQTRSNSQPTLNSVTSLVLEKHGMDWYFLNPGLTLLIITGLDMEPLLPQLLLLLLLLDHTELLFGLERKYGYNMVQIWSFERHFLVQILPKASRWRYLYVLLGILAVCSDSITHCYGMCVGPSLSRFIGWKPVCFYGGFANDVGLLTFYQNSDSTSGSAVDTYCCCCCLRFVVRPHRATFSFCAD